eukprot:TRINITY_DN4321_c0_g1_i1.p1 TRINITY_DN4321_c0_g1~~TRINITY_DN4321_c0_g1_i1.p1  ORF type:complete len:207 (+),score=1.80 TRINITY_DN4321_c0_g1_i1:85-705(+)
MSSTFFVFAVFSVLSGHLAKRSGSEHDGSDTVAQDDSVASTYPAHPGYGHAPLNPTYPGPAVGHPPPYAWGGKGRYHKPKRVKHYGKYGAHYPHGKHAYKYGVPPHHMHLQRRCNTVCGATSWQDTAFDVTIKQLQPSQCADCRWSVNLGHCPPNRAYTLIQRAVSKACCHIIDHADECTGRFGAPLTQETAKAPPQNQTQIAQEE